MAEHQILTDLETKQIGEEIAMCLNAGLTSWQILKTLRFIRQAVEEGKNFSMEKHLPPDQQGDSI